MMDQVRKVVTHLTWPVISCDDAVCVMRPHLAT